MSVMHKRAPEQIPQQIPMPPPQKHDTYRVEVSAYTSLKKTKTEKDGWFKTKEVRVLLFGSTEEYTLAVVSNSADTALRTAVKYIESLESDRLHVENIVVHKIEKAGEVII